MNKKPTKLTELKTILNDFYIMCADMCSDVQMIREALFQRIHELHNEQNLSMKELYKLIDYSDKLIK